MAAEATEVVPATLIPRVKTAALNNKNFFISISPHIFQYYKNYCHFLLNLTTYSPKITGNSHNIILPLLSIRITHIKAQFFNNKLIVVYKLHFPIFYHYFISIGNYFLFHYFSLFFISIN